ncbi:hypothetical protein FRB90_001075 [Tulasnella sp. 427]|nr:hypothetical protein FRB90_001075 [Tulasnella sp. 427]
MFVTFAIVYWIVVPALYYSNVGRALVLWFYLRILNFGYNSDTGRFNLAAYEAYSPIYLPISFALTYTIMFAVPPALIVECVLRYGPFVYRIIRDKKKADFDRDDVHAKLMRRYPEVPQWCYVTLLVAFFALSIGAAFVQPDLDVPLGAIILSIAMAFLFVIPQCYLDSTIALTASINLLPQITAGVFKGYTLSTISVCSGFTQALKLGHYLKVPPRYTFIAALIGLAISTVFQIGVKEWIFADVEDVCRPRQASQLTCSHSQVFYTASIIWGLVGPTRQFGNHGIYYGPVYATIASALLPLMLWWWNRRHRKPSWLRWVNVGVALNVGFIFQYYLRTRQYNWWSRYNYVLAGALDSGQTNELGNIENLL